MSQLSDTLLDVTAAHIQWQNQQSLLVPSCHLLWSQHHPGFSPSASSNAQGSLQGAVRVTLKQILLGGRTWWQSPKLQERTHMDELKDQQLTSNTSQNARAERRDSPWKPHENNHHEPGTFQLCQDTKLASQIQQKPEAPKCNSSHSHRRLDNA